MAEQVLNKPLSGVEVARAIMHDIEYALSRTDALAGHVAYDQFSFHATITVKVPRAPRPEFTREIAGGYLSPQAPADAHELTVERPLLPPNEVRMETGQPVPVLSTDDHGRTTEKLVSYEGKDPEGRKTAMRRAKNVVVGGAGSSAPKAPVQPNGDRGEPAAG